MGTFRLEEVLLFVVDCVAFRNSCASILSFGLFCLFLLFFCIWLCRMQDVLSVAKRVVMKIAQCIRSQHSKVALKGLEVAIKSEEGMFTKLY